VSRVPGIETLRGGDIEASGNDMKLKRCVLPVLFLAAIAAPLTCSAAQDEEDLLKEAQQAIATAPPVHLQATISSIDKTSRVVSVHGPHRDIALVVGTDVPNFDQLRVGDKIDVMYKNALLVTARKVKGKDAGLRERTDQQSYVPASDAGSSGGFESMRQVDVLATVERVDERHRKITLRGPWRTETMDLLPEFQAQHLKPGDTVHAVFLSAAAVRIEPANAAQ
jgi:hypothetical protein